MLYEEVRCRECRGYGDGRPLQVLKGGGGFLCLGCYEKQYTALAEKVGPEEATRRMRDRMDERTLEQFLTERERTYRRIMEPKQPDEESSKRSSGGIDGV